MVYSKAAGFVLPSLLEGVGLLAAEAIDYGVVR
jgi:glycosyltransferase involved in cell wall biosynthesis